MGKLKQIGFIFTGGIASVPLTALGGYMIGNAAGFDGVTCGLITGGISALASGASIVPTLYPRRRRYASTSFGYDTQFTGWTMHPNDTGGYTATFKERPSREFVYWWPGLLPEPVPESVFDDFVTRGYDREKSARNGGRYDRNEAWSANYFCRKRRPAMPWATYQSCMIVLCFTRHHTGKWRTSPGNLVHYHLTVYRLLEAIKEEWLYRQETYQSQQRPGMWRRVAGALK